MQQTEAYFYTYGDRSGLTTAIADVAFTVGAGGNLLQSFVDQIKLGPDCCPLGQVWMVANDTLQAFESILSERQLTASKGDTQKDILVVGTSARTAIRESSW